MDGAPAQGQAQARPTNQQLQNLIRPEQVSRLPHLNAQQKSVTETRVRGLWDYIHANSNNTTDPQYLKASQDLARLSNNLMQGMKQFNAQRQQRQQVQGQAQGQAQAQTQGQTQGAQMPQAVQQGQTPSQAQAQPQAQPQPQIQPIPAPPQAQPSSGAVTFAQLLPEVQVRVNAQTFYFPPAMTEGSRPAEQWLQEAKARFGQAIQRAQMARSKKTELMKAATNRTQSGNPLTQEENNGLNAKLQQCEKAIRESQNFMEKFKEQQETFKNARPQQRFSQPGPSGPSAPGENGPSEGPAQSLQMQPTVQGPQAHSIATAQAAARANAANQSGASVSGVSQPANVTVTSGPQPTPIDQAGAPFNAASTMMPQPQSRPNTAAGPQSAAHPSANMQASHAHPSSAVNPQSFNGAVNGMKSHTAPIAKNLQIPDPTPVQMPPARPTLNGGANVGLPGQLAQPALTTFPGYVLEQSEDGHLLSKKKLNELVREVLGPNSEDQLTPEAEEICLALLDDFIDDLLTTSCRLAKLRGATSLEARDVQVVLERQYNIRVPGFSTDEVRTVRKGAPAAGWAHKVGAVQAAKLMNGSGTGAGVSSGGANAGGATGSAAANANGGA